MTHRALVALAETDLVYEITGYRTLEQDREAFDTGYEVGREDALDNDECAICGRLPAQRAGYAFGYVGELPADEAYQKWIESGRAA